MESWYLRNDDDEEDEDESDEDDKKWCVYVFLISDYQCVFKISFVRLIRLW